VETTTETVVYERVLQIDASPETVWEFLVDPEKVARWKGLPATAFEARPGGGYRIEIIPGHIAKGEFVELERPRRLVYTWGWEAAGGKPHAVPPGTSTIEVELVPRAGGTLVRLTHRDLPSEAEADSHSHGWDHYLERLAVAASGGDAGRDPWLAS
jgi:uncharacterized protein YndB with AHSA1/START domain